MTYYITSNMRPIIGSPIPRRVLAGLCGEELRLERLDDTMLAEVPDALTHQRTLCVSASGTSDSNEFIEAVHGRGNRKHHMIQSLGSRRTTRARIIEPVVPAYTPVTWRLHVPSPGRRDAELPC